MKSVGCFVLLCLMTVPLVESSAQTRSAPGKSSSNTLAQEIAAAKRAGFPVSAKDLQAPLPPPAQNAALLYAQLDALLKKKPVSMANEEIIALVMYKRPPNAQQVAMARRVLAGRKDVHDLIHKAASLPKCVFARDWAKGSMIPFPEYARMRTAVRWLSAESSLLLQDKKPLEAVRNQTLGFQIGRHTATDPMLIANLVADAVDAITLSGMEKILYAAGSDPAVDTAVRQAVEKHWTPHSLAHSLRGDATLEIIDAQHLRKEGQGALQTLTMGGPLPAGFNVPRDQKSWNRFVDENIATELHAMRQMSAVADQPYPKAHSAISTIDAVFVRKQSDPAYFLGAIAVPIDGQAVVQSARIQAHVDIIRSAAALLVWKARHGAFPATLAAAISPVPTDPFIGKPLKYRREGKGFVVYSVGQTGKFDGGKPNVAPPVIETLFRYPLPSYIQTPVLSSPGMGSPPGGPMGLPQGRRP
jgi:hypothetical protein